MARKRTIIQDVDGNRLFTRDEMKEIIKIASHAGVTAYNKKHADELEKKHDIAVENTVKLLEGYNAMKLHCSSAISRAEESLTPSSLQAVLLEVFDRRGFLQVEGILSSKRRTELIIEHIDTMLKVYEKQCKQKRKPYYECLIMAYIDGLSHTEISEKKAMSERTIYNWINQGLDDMAVLLFGAAVI